VTSASGKDVCSALYDRMSGAEISYDSGDPESRLALSISPTEVGAAPVFHLMTESSGFWNTSRLYTILQDGIYPENKLLFTEYST
jgi:hypothetical protein